MANLLLAVCMSLAASTTVSAAQVSSPVLDPKRVKKGQTIYRQYCSSCHGGNAEGASDWQEPNEQGELPPPPHDQEGHTWRHSDADLYAMIAKGWRDPFNETDHLTMPPFGETLTPDEIEAMVTYFKSLWTEEQRRYQRQESLKEPFPAETKHNP